MFRFWSDRRRVRLNRPLYVAEAIRAGHVLLADTARVAAAGRGWTALDLFGVQRRAGAFRSLRRVDAAAHAITFGPLIYRRRPMPEAVIVWGFRRRNDMTIVDLSTVRATRAAELQAAKELTDTAVATMKAMAEAYADMAFGLSGPVRMQNEQLAVDVNRSQWRRALATVKASTRQGTPEIRGAFRNIASHAFTERLDNLIREDDKRRGVTNVLEVVGGMWVTAGRTRWKPNPWPCVFSLGRPEALAWIDHIERTPYAMKPATRQRFGEARAALQDPERWPSEAAEKTVNRIIRACWERGWIPKEKAV